MDEIGFFYSGWEPLARIVLVGTAGYFALVSLLRVSGSRSLAQLNAFDFVITVALGAAFGRILTARSVALSEAITAFGLLVLLQYLVSRIQLGSGRFSRVVTAAPSLLFYRGNFEEHEMRRQRLRREDLCAVAIRHGAGSMNEVEAILIEANGNFGVIKKGGGTPDLPLIRAMASSAGKDADDADTDEGGGSA